METQSIYSTGTDSLNVHNFILFVNNSKELLDLLAEKNKLYAASTFKNWIGLQFKLKVCDQYKNEIGERLFLDENETKEIKNYFGSGESTNPLEKLAAELKEMLSMMFAYVSVDYGDVLLPSIHIRISLERKELWPFGYLDNSQNAKLNIYFADAEGRTIGDKDDLNDLKFYELRKSFFTLKTGHITISKKSKATKEQLLKHIQNSLSKVVQ